MKATSVPRVSPERARSRNGAEAYHSMSTAIEPDAHVLAPSRDAWVEDVRNATLLARGSIEAASLLQDVSPISGPENGGTSLTVVLGGNQPANGPHQWKLGLAGLTTLHCAPAVELPSADHLRCCCTPEAPSNLSRVALTLLRCARGDDGCAPAAAPVSFRYYRDPQFVRATPDRGQVSGGELITVFARDWPDASVVGAAAPRCRFGSMQAVPATVTPDSRAGRRGEVKLVCTSPNFHRAHHHAAGSVWLTCSPNGADFPSGTVEGTRTVERSGLYFRYSTNPQSTTHMLLAFVVLLAGFLLIRLVTWIHGIIAPVLARRKEAQAEAEAEATLKGKRAEAFVTRCFSDIDSHTRGGAYESQGGSGAPFLYSAVAASPLAARPPARKYK